MFGIGSNKSSGSSGEVTASKEKLYGFDLEAMIGSYADAAFALSSEDGRVLASNAQADTLLEVLDQGQENPLAAIIQRSVEYMVSVAERMMVRVESQTLVYQINTFVLQVAESGPVVLVMARDMTADRNIIDALVASRELFKDLVACSSDFAWETDEKGCFTYVSKEGALGFAPSDLVGKRARVLDFEEDDRPFPFDAVQPMEDVELWLRTAESNRAFCRVSSRPVVRDGQVVAVRGVSRDITDEHMREAELERRRMQEKLLQRIVDALRTEFDPKRLLNTAATLPTQVLNAEACWVFMGDAEDSLEIQMQYPNEDADMAMVAEELVYRASKLADDVLPVEASVQQRSLIADVTKFRDEINGAIVMARGTENPNWTEDERQLIASVAAHLGIAFHQIKERQVLERLSRIDEVTGLKNRRAFMSELEHRLQHVRRYNRQGVLAYVDLDNFKAVNDLMGHQVGDGVLRETARILSVGHRAGDLAARIGGDEFVVWLEETDLSGACQWAERVLAGCVALEDITAAKAPAVTFSIGLAAYEANDTTDMDALLHRADAAMYEAKKNGKAAYYIAPPAEMA